MPVDKYYIIWYNINVVKGRTKRELRLLFPTVDEQAFS